jgi:hypothetical protein
MTDRKATDEDRRKAALIVAAVKRIKAIRARLERERHERHQSEVKA